MGVSSLIRCGGLHLSVLNGHVFYLTVQLLEISAFETCVLLRNSPGKVLELKYMNTCGTETETFWNANGLQYSEAERGTQRGAEGRGRRPQC